MNVLFAASECAPFIKTGGLGDVIGALPKSLVKLDVKVSVVVPKYQDLPGIYKEKMKFLKSITVPVGWRSQYCGIFSLEEEGVTYYFLDNEYYFKRHGSYGFYDDGERFAFFSRAVLELATHLEEPFDIIHSHDWQTAPINVLLKAHYKYHPKFTRMKTLFTIHNLKYQGVFSKSVLSELLDLSDLYFTADGLEFYDQVNYMKAGLGFADVITTVSPTYASEIQTASFGENLEGVLMKRNHDLHGIINGIDQEAYNPETDEKLYQQFKDFEGKQANKRQLQSELGLEINERIPLLSMVTRLVEQKGIDLILRVFHEILQLDVQFVILGTGDAHYENTLKELATHYPGKVVFCCYFDDGLARRIYAGSDVFLMPSKFEPCGIGQLLAFRYGALPLVRETGGLKDTVQPYNEFTNEGTGFSFTNYNAHDMLHAIEYALWLYRHHPQTWQTCVERALQLDFSWRASSVQYVSLYKELIQAPSPIGQSS